MLTYIRSEASGLWYEWNGAHTVNVQYERGGQDVDCYSIGDFAENAATYDEFVESIDEYEMENGIDDAVIEGEQIEA